MCVGNLARVVAVCAIGLSLALFTPLSARSDIITYGDFSGTEAVFKAVTESTAVPGNTVLNNGFGLPVVSGNTLVFTPQSFVAYSAGGMPDFSDSHLSMTIAAVANKVIQTVTFTEAGDYSLVGQGSALTRVAVAMPSWLTVTKVNGVAIDPIQIAGSGVFVPGGLYNLPAHEGTGVPWNGNLQFDVTAALRANGIQAGYATEVILSLDNSLVATSEGATIAYIAKKVAQVTVDAEPVPEPGTWVLLGIGAVGLVGYRWRRQQNVQHAA